MEYGFSCMGFFFMALIVGPSFYFVGLPGYPCYRARKSGIFQGLDRIGLTASACIALISRNLDYRGPEPWLSFLILAILALALYEVHWILCIRRSCLPLHLGKVPLTALSPLALVLLAVYGRSIYLLLSAVLYGIGHILGTRSEPDGDWNCCCCSDL